MSSTNCGFAVDTLWDWVDGLLADVESAAVQAHVEACGECRGRLEEVRRLHSSLEAISASATPIPATIGPYRVVREIGAGGMGMVYEAEQQNPSRSVALKVMRPTPGTSERRLRAFRREIQALGRLNHPSIATVYEAGCTDGGQLYLVMQLVDGKPIDRHCDEAGHDLRARVEWMARVADAAHHAHERGVLHRDLKPANILVDANGQPTVLDFGLARFMSPEHDVTGSPSITGLPSGTLPYMSPEQLGGIDAELSAGTDVYSLGVVLYELLTGQLPYPRTSNLQEAQHAMALRDAPHPSAVQPAIPRELGDVVMKAIEKPPARRYGTAAALATDLRNFLSGAAVMARPPSALYRLRVLTRRRWRTAAVASLVVLSTVGLWPDEAATRAEVRKTLLQIPAAPLYERFARQFDFSADGQTVVHGSDPSGRIFIWDRGTTVSREVALEAEPGWVLRTPRWSRDGQIALIGRRVTPVTESGQVEGVFLLDPASGRLTTMIRPLPSLIRDLCWTPDGSAVTFVDPTGKVLTARIGETTPKPWPGLGLDGHRRAMRATGYSADAQWLLLEVRVGDADKATELWSVPAGGGRAIQLTAREIQARHPTWHPAGSVWFVATSGEGGNAATNLWKLEVDRHTGRPLGQPAQVTFNESGEIEHPKFVADGRELVCRVTFRNRTVRCAEHDRLGAAVTLTRGDCPAVAADGESIYYLATAPETGLYRVARSGGQPTRVVEDLAKPKMWPNRAFDVSPDDRHVAFVVKDAAGLAVCVAPTAGGPPRILDRPTDPPTTPLWSPDGRHLAYAEHGAVYVTRVAGGGRERIAQLWKWHELHWSPSGDALAGLGYENPGDDRRIAVFRITFPGRELQRITPDQRYKEGLCWHPSGEFLTYMWYGPTVDGAQIRVAYPDGRETELLFDQRDHWDWVGAWHPDGQRFFFHSSAADCAGIHVFRRSDGSVVHDIGLPQVPRWSRDGKVAVWAQTDKSVIRHFEVLHDLGR